MKYLIALMLLSLVGCASARVLVQDCQDAGPGLKNCELVKKL